MGIISGVLGALIKEATGGIWRNSPLKGPGLCSLTSESLRSFVELYCAMSGMCEAV